MAELCLRRNLITPVAMRIRVVVPSRMPHSKLLLLLNYDREISNYVLSSSILWGFFTSAYLNPTYTE